MPKLNDTQLILLSAAAQHDQGSFYPLPVALAGTGDRATNAVTALIKLGLAIERETNQAGCIQRVDGDLRFGIFITDEGLTAIGVGDAVDIPSPRRVSARQREACAAYILSQASEGWTALPDIYDDGGLSGGTLERPALQRLLAEVAAGRVDIIVVYKVDRLTRSLLDFSKLVEAFDRAGTSFVSVTQSFNTTTSMGRLTLNMLLSFAQFEREVTAERIRDKIAASKAKGMWMGGIPPLGYEPDGRSLKVVEDHATMIRDIFERYLRLIPAR
jgi:DNA invertase Pin-like site-specific DNA recombinase